MSLPSASEMFDATKVILRMLNLPTLTSADFEVLKRAADISLNQARWAKKTKKAA